MNITRAAIEKNRVTAVALLIVVLGGLSAYNSLPRSKDPTLTIRVAQIMTIFPGASPERVEQLVSDKLEKAAQELPELDYVSSISKPGVSIVYVTLKQKYMQLRPIWDKLRRRVEDVRAELPQGIVGPFVNDEFGDVFGILFTITGDGFSYAELKEIADDVRDELLLNEQVAKVDIVGVQAERIFIEYKNARLARLGLSPAQLQQILESRNIIIPGGEVYTGDESIVLEPTGNFVSIEDLRRTVVRLPGQKQVTYLGDIVDVRRGYVEPPEMDMRTNGAPALGLAISLRKGGNIITLGKQVTELYERLPGLYPHGVEFEMIAYEPAEVLDKVDDFVSNLMQSVLIVLLVMLVFLGLRTGLLVASLIPTTMVMAMLVMSFFGIGLNQVSLAALMIALGLLVDNAIVMSESVMVKMEAGEKAIEAAIASAKELRIPLLTSSLTTCAAFLPIYLAESDVGQYTAPLFQVVTISLLCSWVLALTMTPLLCVTFMKVKKRGGKGVFAFLAPLVARLLRGKKSKGGPEAEHESGAEFDGLFYRAYRAVLFPMLRFRYLTLAGAIAVFVVAMMGFSLVPKLFFPPDVSPQFTATFKLPIGTPIERTQQLVDEIEDHMRAELLIDEERKDGIRNWSSFIGAGAPRYTLGYNPEPPSPGYALMVVNTTSATAAQEIMPRLERFAFERYPDLEINIKGSDTGPPVSTPIEVRISGAETDKVFAIVDQVKAKVRSIDGTRLIRDDWGPRTKKLLVEVSQPRAYRAGVTNQDIALSLLTNLSGYEVSQYREEDRVIPIVMRSVEADRRDIGKLESLNIFAQASGANVPLKQVADTEMAWEPSQVIRRNGLRTVSVLAELEPWITAAEVNAQLIPWLDEQKKGWDLGYRYEIGGEWEASGKADASIAEKMPIALMCILILLIVQFNSLRRTFIILFTIPLALIGVVVGLLAAKSYFGFMTLLGIISLAGIVINNAIVLLERIKLEVEENGLEPRAAVVEAAQRRMRPILLTTATTIGGLLPLWFGGGAMWEPMAISIIFGLLFSTVLTLGVVPALYSTLFRVSFRDYRP